MREVVKIVLYKKLDKDIKPDGEDVLKVVDYAIAEVDPSGKSAYILSGDYMGYQIDKLDVDYDKREFSFMKINMASVVDHRTFTMGEIVEKLKRRELPKYYHVSVDDNGEIILHSEVNSSLKISYERTPSLRIYKRIVDKLKEEYGSSEMEKYANNKVVDTVSSSESSFGTQSFDEANIEIMLAELKKIIVGLDDELKQVLVNITKNISLSYSNLNSSMIRKLKSSLLLLGDEGTGKTFMVENIAKLLGVPLVVVDGKELMASDHDTCDVNVVLEKLYYAVNGDLEAFEHGIIFIDNIDLLCASSGSPVSSYVDKIQSDLAKLIDGVRVSKAISKGASTDFVTLDSSKVTFVFAGEFPRIYRTDLSWRRDASLRESGLNDDLFSRLSMKVITHAPTDVNLKDALVNSKNGVIRALKEYLSIFGIELEVTEEFIDEVVEKAQSIYDQGYNALNTVVNSKIEEYLFRLYKGDIKRLVLGERHNDSEV